MNLSHVKNKIHSTAATNRSPVYDTHIYWSQKPYNICDILIESLSREGETVFDPFLGSGVTLLQAISAKHKRAAIGCEINEAPLFIVKTLLKNYDGNEFKKILGVFLERIAGLQPYYQTVCGHCGASAIITSVLFDMPGRTSPAQIKKINYRCGCLSQKNSKDADELDYAALNVQPEIRNIRDFELVPDSKLAVYENQTISQIFTKRNFAVLDEIIGIIDGLEKYQDLFRYILMSVLHLCKITDTHSNSQWPLWIPKVNCVEKNIVDILTRKAPKFLDAIGYAAENFGYSPQYKPKFLLLQKGSQHITAEDIPDGSVHLIITDPPYLGQVAYSEYMQLYKPFLGLNYNLEDEIVVSSAPSREKNEAAYFDMLDRVFEICASKLQEGRYFCMYFHDSSLDVWARLIKSLASHHLRYISQAHIAKSNTLKNIISPKKSLNGDCVLFFIKDSGTGYEISGTEPIGEIEENIIRQAGQLLNQYGTLSTPQLYDNGLMEVLIQNGWLSALAKKYKTLVDIFEKNFKWDPQISKWTV